MKKILLSLALAAASFFHINSAHAYLLDQTNHIAYLYPTDSSPSMIAAVSTVANRADKSVHWIINFAPGIYNLTKGFYFQHLENLGWVGNGAVLQKGTGWSNEYIMYMPYAQNMTIKGFTFKGLTNYSASSACVWGEQGIYLGSTKNVTVDHNKFQNFGDAALRVTTYDNDPILGVNSFNNQVTNNVFSNICQTSTTSNSLNHGGTAYYLFQFNAFYNIHGSVKFASRTAGATDVKVLNNAITGSTNHGIEIDNYQNMIVQNNSISNITNAAVTIYTNPRAAEDFVWGDNLLVKGNAISNASIGIRFSPQPFADGYTFIPKNVTISYNKLDKILGSNPGIYVINGMVNTLNISNNTLTNIASGKAISIVPGSTNITNTGNTMDGISVK